MARKTASRKTTRKSRRPGAPLHESRQEMSAMQVWLWIIGGMVLLAIVFAIIDILKARYWS